MEFVNVKAAFYTTTLLMFLSEVVNIGMEMTHPEFGTQEQPAPTPEPSPQIVTEDQSQSNRPPVVRLEAGEFTP